MEANETNKTNTDNTNKTKPKVLIGCITYYKQAYILNLLIDSIKKFQAYQLSGSSRLKFDFDILFVDNSPDKTYKQVLEKKLSAAGFAGSGKNTKNINVIVVYDPPGQKNRIEKIISGRNVARQIFLGSKDYTHLFFLDTDIIAPAFAISRLLGHSLQNPKEIFAGIYLVEQEISGKNRVMPLAYVDYSEPNSPNSQKNGYVRQLKISEVFDPQIIRAAATGLGCALISRAVLEKVSFRNIGSSATGGEDAAFYLDARKHGFNLFIDTSIKCDHYAYPTGHKENVFLMLSKYRKKSDPIAYSYNIKI